MSRMLILLFSIIMTVKTVAANECDGSLYSLSKMERLVLICKKYETNHRNCGNTVGYGHLIQEGEPYRYNQNLSEREADKLLRSDITKLLAQFKDYGEYQYVLAAVSFNVGIGKICGSRRTPKSGLLKAIESGKPVDEVKSLYLQYRNAWGRPVKSLYMRRLVEWELLMEN